MSKEPGKCPFPGCERPIAPGGHRCAECTSSYHSDEETVDAQEEEIRRLRDEEKLSFLVIAAKLNWIVDVATIRAAATRVTWRHVR